MIDPHAAPTLRQIITEILEARPDNTPGQLPLTYCGFPVDLSNLDAPVAGFVVARGKLSK